MQEITSCEICARTFLTTEGRFPVGKPVIHHLVPRQKYRGKSSEAVTIIICSRCHKHIHRLYDNYTLKKYFSTLDEIKENEEMIKFVKWIRKE